MQGRHGGDGGLVRRVRRILHIAERDSGFVGDVTGYCGERRGRVGTLLRAVGAVSTELSVYSGARHGIDGRQ